MLIFTLFLLIFDFMVLLLLSENVFVQGLEFSFYENHTVELVNTHRVNAKLKFSILGATISSIVEKNEFLDDHSWRLALSDHTELFIERLATDKAKDFAEYQLTWSGNGSSLEREVCFHYGFNNASWYAGYENAYKWPMNPLESIPKSSSFTVGPQFGSVLENIFINSDGFALRLYDIDAWFIRTEPGTIPSSPDPKLCFSIDQNRPPYKSSKEIFNLVLRIMAGVNIRSTHEKLFHQSGWIKTPNSGAKVPSEALFKYPIWSTKDALGKDLNQSSILEFASDIKKQGYPTGGTLEIHDRWEKHYGDLEFDTEKFPDSKKLIEELHKLGFKVQLWIHPFVNQDSVIFNSSSRYFVKDKAGLHTELVNWWDGNSSAIIDFSTLEKANWFIDRLKKLQQQHLIDSFNFDAGELAWYGSDFTFVDTVVQENPNLITYRYIRAAGEFGSEVMLRSSFWSQDLPLFIRLSAKQSNWSPENGLRSLIRNVLTLSIVGYSFVLPDNIGGSGHPTEELYIRWLQASVFLPAVEFSIPPWTFPNSTNLIKKFINLRTEHVPTIVALAKKVSEGQPLIRPMWYAMSDDSRAYSVDDQFMLGEDILVAPVLVEAQRERPVLLPSGDWLDQHGKVLTGPVVVQVSAPLEELPFFKRKH